MEKEIARTTEAVEGIVKAIPIYEDALQPGAKQVGKSLETIGKALNVVLAPVSSFVWGYEKIKDFVESEVGSRLVNLKVEEIITPNPTVAGPLLEALRYAGHEESLRELYANLLATSMDINTVVNAHPSFVEIIKNISPDEAKIIKLFSKIEEDVLLDVKIRTINEVDDRFKIVSSNFSQIGIKAECEHKELTPNYLDNLCRLGLLKIPEGIYKKIPQFYEDLKSDSRLDEIKKIYQDNKEFKVDFAEKKIELTSLGKQFCLACVLDRRL